MSVSCARRRSRRGRRRRAARRSASRTGPEKRSISASTCAGDSSLIRRASRMRLCAGTAPSSSARHQRNGPSLGRLCPPTPTVGTSSPPHGARARAALGGESRVHAPAYGEEVDVLRVAVPCDFGGVRQAHVARRILERLHHLRRRGVRALQPRRASRCGRTPRRRAAPSRGRACRSACRWRRFARPCRRASPGSGCARAARRVPPRARAARTGAARPSACVVGARVDSITTSGTDPDVRFASAVATPCSASSRCV